MCSFNPFAKIKKKPLDLLDEAREVTGVIVLNEFGEPVLLTDFTNRTTSVSEILKSITAAGAEDTIICTFRGNKKRLVQTISLIKAGNFSNNLPA